MKELEDYRFPEVKSEIVKQCMCNAVKNALEWQKENMEMGEYPDIPVGVLNNIFRTLSDCDLSNKECINSKFKKIIDTVFRDITVNEVLEILNDAYAIAIHAANTDYPEYEKRNYNAMAAKPLRSTCARDMVIAFGAFLFKDYAQSANILDVHKSDTSIHIYFTILVLDSLDVFYEGNEYDTAERKSLEDLIKKLNPPPTPIETFIDAIVRYAETLSPSEQRTIGNMLHAKGAAGRYIPNKVYEKYELRIDKLAACPVAEPTTYKSTEPQKAQSNHTETPHESQPTLVNSETRANASTNKKTKKGRRAKPLFSDEAEAQNQAVLFKEYLREEGLLKKEITAQQNDPITSSFLCFCDSWKNSFKNVYTYTHSAATRFLEELCGLTFGCAQKTYEGVIGKLHKEKRVVHYKTKVELFLNRLNEEVENEDTNTP